MLYLHFLKAALFLVVSIPVYAADRDYEGYLDRVVGSDVGPLQVRTDGSTDFSSEGLGYEPDPDDGGPAFGLIASTEGLGDEPDPDEEEPALDFPLVKSASGMAAAPFPLSHGPQVATGKRKYADLSKLNPAQRYQHRKDRNKQAARRYREQWNQELESLFQTLVNVDAKNRTLLEEVLKSNPHSHIKREYNVFFRQLNFRPKFASYATAVTNLEKDVSKVRKNKLAAARSREGRERFINEVLPSQISEARVWTLRLSDLLKAKATTTAFI